MNIPDFDPTAIGLSRHLSGEADAIQASLGLKDQQLLAKQRQKIAGRLVNITCRMASKGSWQKMPRAFDLVTPDFSTAPHSSEGSVDIKEQYTFRRRRGLFVASWLISTCSGDTSYRTQTELARMTSGSRTVEGMRDDLALEVLDPETDTLGSVVDPASPLWDSVETSLAAARNSVARVYTGSVRYDSTSAHHLKGVEMGLGLLPGTLSRDDRSR